MVVYFWAGHAAHDDSLQRALLDMEARDQAVRNALTAAGALDLQYHPKLEALQRANARRLKQIVALFGWPGRALVGDAAAKSAWRIALHSIADPVFMRRCRDLIARAAESSDVPRWQFAIIEDRVRVYEGRPQRFGTQLRVGPHGPEPHPLEDDARVDTWRAEWGLPPLARVLAQARAQPAPATADAAIREAAEREFRQRVGWI